MIKKGLCVLFVWWFAYLTSPGRESVIVGPFKNQADCEKDRLGRTRWPNKVNVLTITQQCFQQDKPPPGHIERSL